MSQFHKPGPRQNVHRGRSPVKKLKVAPARRVKANPNNAATNELLQRSGLPARGATPGQIVASTKTN
jgi:hypothetical protein